MQKNGEQEEKYRQRIGNLKGEKHESNRQFSYGILRCRRGVLPAEDRYRTHRI